MFTIDRAATTNARFSLWLSWVGASALGVLLAFALFLALFTVTGEPPEPLFPVIMAGVGTLLGAGQQRVLRRVLGRVAGWVVATGVGFGLGITLALIIGEGDGLLAHMLAGAVHGAGIGVIVGTLQYLVLKPHVANARRWIPASIGAWMLGAVAAAVTGYFVDGLDILVGPVVAAAASGVAVVRLLLEEAAAGEG
jgi:hypothetical protein